MSSLPVLALPNFSAVFDVITDASATAMGAVLSQDTQHIAFSSKKIGPRMQIASAYDREMFAITEAIKKWRQYLLGRHFRIYTDQKEPSQFALTNNPNPAQQKWLTKLLGFDYEIFYTPGRSNVVANALSRSLPSTESSYTAFSACQPLILEQLRDLYINHPIGKKLLDKFQHSDALASAFTIQQGVLYVTGCLFIPAETGLHPLLLEEFHSSAIGGHFGVKATLASCFFHLATHGQSG